MSSTLLDTYTHEYDETGSLPENRISNEERILDNQMAKPAIIPKYGSFYTKSLKIRSSTGVPLTKSQYQLGLHMPVVSGKTGKETCSAIIITDPNIRGKVFIDYQCVGGPWGVTNERFLEFYKSIVQEERPVDWDNIIGKPDRFRPATHFADIGNLYGSEYFIAAIERLTAAVLMGDNASHEEILRMIRDSISDLDDKLANLAAALTDRINALELKHDRDIVALTKKIDDHIQDKENPHETKADQTGAYTKLEIDTKFTDERTYVDKTFVKINKNEATSVRIQNNEVQVYTGNTWVTVWPPKWQ